MTYTIKDRNSHEIIAEGPDGEAEDSVRVLEGSWYFKPTQVDMTHLVMTERTYNCPYKGICHWIDLDSPTTQARNIAFVYKSPMTGYEFIKDRIAFYGRDTSGTIAQGPDIQDTASV